MTYEAAGAIVLAAPGVAASLAGLVWTVGRILRPWMRDEATKANQALYERLRHNDFKHAEDRVAAGLEGVSKRLDGIDGRLDRMEEREAAMESRLGGRLERMEARLLTAHERAADRSSDGSESG